MALYRMDSTWVPKGTARVTLQKRLTRLQKMRDSTEQAATAFTRAAGGAAIPDRLTLRNGFVYRSTPAPGGGSDRRAPARAERPPATRIATSRGSALRLELVALALAQSQGRRRAGLNQLPLRPDAASSHPLGWVDLLASPAEFRGSGRSVATVQDKKLRHIHSALDRMEAASLVLLPHAGATRGAYEDFRLLDERGARAEGDPITYRLPGPSEEVFELPMALITRGWVHVLEDSELSLLLMTACGLGRLPGEARVAIPADTRLLNYGISRDAFDAHHVLQDLDLLDVVGDDHYDDGRAVGFSEDGAHLHRLQLQPDAFEQDGLTTTISSIEHLLKKDSSPVVRRVKTP